MQKIWAIAFLFIILVLSNPIQSGLYSDIYKDAKLSVVVIYAYDSQKEPLSQGTGFFIDKAGYIITNFHIINGSSKAIVTTADGHTYQVKNVLAKDIASDLACLSVDIPPQLVYPIKVNSTFPEVGEDIFVIGYPEGPGGLVQSMKRGIVSSVQTLNEYGEVIQIDAAVSPGASGSPLINMKREAIGITTFGYIKGQNQNFAVSYSQVSKMIRNISPESQKSISKWNLTSEEELLFIGIDQYRRGEYDQAVQHLEEAIKLNPQDALALIVQGDALNNLGRYDEAIQAYDKAIEVNTLSADAWNNKEGTFSLQGKYDEAIKAYDKAIEIDPKLALLGLTKDWYLASRADMSWPIKLLIVLLESIRSLQKPGTTRG